MSDTVAPSLDYAFEKDEKTRQRRSLLEIKTDAQTAAKCLMERIGADAEKWKTLNSQERKLIERYSYNHQVAIAWYAENREKKLASQRCFFIGSVALVVAIPVLVAVLGACFGDNEKFMAQISATITGVLGLQKAIQSWMQRGNLASIWWEAGADLKEDLYELENRWRDQDGFLREVKSKKDSEYFFTPSFRNDLQTGIETANKIIRKEKSLFFKAMGEFKTLDVAGLISSSAKNTKSITDELVGDALREEIEKNAKLEAQASLVAENGAALAFLEASLTRLEKELEDALATGAKLADAAYQKLLQRYDALSTKRDNAELALRKAEAKLRG